MQPHLGQFGSLNWAGRLHEILYRNMHDHPHTDLADLCRLGVAVGHARPSFYGSCGSVRTGRRSWPCTTIHRDLADLCGLGVAVGHDQITIGSLHTCVDLDQRLPLPDEGAEPVTSEAHAVEVRRAIPAPDKNKTQIVEML